MKQCLEARIRLIKQVLASTVVGLVVGYLGARALYGAGMLISQWVGGTE